MDNSLLAVRDINHKYIVVDKGKDMSMKVNKVLPSPAELKEEYPLSEKLIQLKKERDAEIRDIFTGKSDKFAVIIGPCSADNEDSVSCHDRHHKEMDWKNMGLGTDLGSALHIFWRQNPTRRSRIE